MVKQVIFVSATPGPYELAKSKGVIVEQVIRPTGLVDPEVEIPGTLWSLSSHEAKDFLTRHQIPYQWLDIESDSAARRLVEQVSPEFKLPVIFFPDGTTLISPDLRQLADKVGLQTRAGLPFYDLVVIGSGPAGLAGAVYAGSEGLKCVVIE